MSQETLRRLLERINTDQAFRERLEKDPENALREADISTVEGLALAMNDQDALRRLLGDEEVSGYSIYAYQYFNYNAWYAGFGTVAIGGGKPGPTPGPGPTGQTH
jgi:hypothetical protein